MDRRRFLRASTTTLGWALHSKTPSLLGEALKPDSTKRRLLIYTDERLGDVGQTFVERLESASPTSPLLKVLSGGNPIRRLDLSTPEAQIAINLAYNHVVLIGFADDELLREAWQMEATISKGSLSAFGFGNFRGSLGYIESDRNPFLHAANIPKAPYECELICITGTDIPGITLALDSFLTNGMVSGIVARPGSWTRASQSLLDRDPMLCPFTLPPIVPPTLGTMNRIAFIQPSEDEYRGVLADAGHEPLSIWRVKYHEPGQWDGAGEVASFHNYSAGLHRRSYGNTVWAAAFSNETIASVSAPLIAKAAGLHPSNSRWQGNLPAYAWGIPELGDAPHPGSLELWVESAFVLMSGWIRPS